MSEPSSNLTREEHIERHKDLQKALDELVADWIDNSPPYPGKTRLPSQHTIAELMEWSHQQTVNPEGE